MNTIDQYAEELQGAWVALVPAENNRHLSMEAPTPQASEPVGRFVEDEFNGVGFVEFIPFNGAPLKDGDLLYRETKPCERCAELEASLETERIRIAACGVVAMANTPESAAKVRNMLPEYWSASCDDVARVVDSEMSLRAQLAALEAENARLAEDLSEREKSERHFYDLSCRQDTTIAQQAERIKELEAESEQYAQLQSRCYEGFPSATDGILDYVKHQAAQLEAAQKDVRRLDDLDALIVAGDISIEREPKSSKFQIYTDTTGYDNPFTGATLREVIDAATAARKEAGL